MAKALQNTLARCGLTIAKVGPTFQSDHKRVNGEVFGSALDHVYYSSAFENKIITSSLKNSSADHLPVICEIRSIPKILPYTRLINKRCLKNFSESFWSECLESQDWSDLENCNSVMRWWTSLLAIPTRLLI